jgi:hypothetical protein
MRSLQTHENFVYTPFSHEFVQWFKRHESYRPPDLTRITCGLDKLYMSDSDSPMCFEECLTIFVTSEHRHIKGFTSATRNYYNLS